MDQQRKDKLAKVAADHRNRTCGPSKLYKPRSIPLSIRESLGAPVTSDPPSGWLVRRALSKDKSIRSFRQVHAVRGELEMEKYGHGYLKSHFVGQNEINEQGKRIMILPLLTFIDGFGLYHNMYRSLTGIYVTPCNLELRQRSRLENMYPVTLGPHGSQLRDVLKCLGTT